MKLSNNLKNQNGMATLMIVMIIGMVLTVSTLSVVYASRSTQEKQVTTHAITHAQAGVWAGAEIFRTYYNRLSSEDRVDIKVKQITIPFGDFGNSYLINITDYQPKVGTTPERATAIITFKNELARSSAQIEVTVQDETTQTTVMLTSGAMNFYTDVNFSGAVSLTVNDGHNKIKVKGDVNLSNIGLTGLEEIEATGSITANSNSHFTYLKSNDNILLQQGASTDSAYALGHINVSGGGYIKDEAHANEWVEDTASGDGWSPGTGYVGTTIKANALERTTDIYGDYILDASGDYVYVKMASSTSMASKANMSSAKASIYVNSRRTYNTLESEGFISIGQVSVANDVSTIADVFIGKPIQPNSLNKVYAGGNIICNANWWDVYTELNAGNRVNNCKNTHTIKQNQTLTFDPIEKVTRFEIDEKPVVDVWALQEYANYSFSIDVTSSEMLINIKDVSVLDDGLYRFYTQAAKPSKRYKKQLLCKVQYDGAGQIIRNVTRTGSNNQINWPTCATVDRSNQSLCVSSININNKSADDYNNGCFSYSTGLWTVDGDTIAPGVYFFEDNLKVKTNLAHATLLSAKNISAGIGDNTKVKAINYAGYDAVCNNYFDAVAVDASKSIGPMHEFDGFYPTNYCEKSGSKAGALQTNSLGNVVFGAGGTHPDGNVYEGGDIELGGSVELFGTVMAGNNLTTSGNVVIHGYIIALNNSNSDSSQNVIGNSITIDLEGAPVTYNPNEIPSVDNVCLEDSSNTIACEQATGENTVQTTSETIILWSRYK